MENRLFFGKRRQDVVGEYFPILWFCWKKLGNISQFFGFVGKSWGIFPNSLVLLEKVGEYFPIV